MRYSPTAIARGVAVMLATCSMSGCGMVGELDISGPVLPRTLLVILVLLAGMFAVAWLRYAHREEAAESGGPPQR